MYKLTFTLKQHTPIIHFQHDQAGATLRASEVKPKLDKFIIEQLTALSGEAALNKFRNGTTKKIKLENDLIDNPTFNKEWQEMLIGGKNDHLALDYKMRIVSDSVKTDIENNHTNSPMYFGNQRGSIPKHFMKAKNISITITTFCNALEIKLKANIDAFFKLNNFGTRQNKGYGSFTMIPKKGFKIFKFENIYSLDFTLNSEYDTKILQVIDYYYKRLKSGINYSCNNGNRHNNTESYKKSYLFKYYDEKRKAKSINYNWEKKWIKKKFWGIADDSVENKFIRGYFGLAGNFSFKLPNNDCCAKKENSDRASCQCKVGMEIAVKDETKTVERIKSPITFKPIVEKNDDNRFLVKVYILINPMDAKEINFAKAIDFNFSPKLSIKSNKFENGIKKPNKENLNLDNTRNVANKFESLKQIENNNTLTGNDKPRIGQADCFKALINNMVAYNLKLPDTYPDIEEIIKKYNTEELKNLFNPIDFRVNTIVEKVTIKQNNPSK